MSQSTFVALVFRPPDALICSERESLVERPTRGTFVLQNPNFPVDRIKQLEYLLLLGWGEIRNAHCPRIAVSGVGHVSCHKATVQPGRD